MKTYSKIAIALVSMVGVTFAQPAQPPAKPGAAAPVKTVAPAPVPKDAKAPVAPVVPPAAKEAPKPPTEIAELTKSMNGTWKCTGTAMGMDMQMAPTKATVKMKADLDGFWMQQSYEGSMGKAKFKFVSYTSYDAAAKKFRRVAVDNMGGQMIGTSDGMKDMKMDFNMDTMGGMGPAGQFRDHLDMTDAKAGTKSWGEMSMDKGKTWVKAYEVTCKK